MKKQTFLISLFTFILMSCTNVQPVQVNDFIAEYEAIQKENDTDSIWPQFNDEEAKSKQNKLTDFISRLTSLDTKNLELEDEINRDLLLLIATDELEALNFGIHEFPLNAEGGFLTNIIFNFRGGNVATEEGRSEYLDKLKALPAYLDQRIGHMKSGLEKGVVSPKVVTEICIGIVKEVVDDPLSERFFYKPSEDDGFNEKVSEVISSEVVPAYERVYTFLENEYLNGSPGEVGVRTITGGEAYYEHRTRYFATDDITPKEVFDIGMEEVKRIRSEMEAIIQELEFEGSFSDFQDFLRTSPQFYAKSPEEILQKAAWITKRTEGELPKYFGKLPRMPLTVKPVPAAIAPNYTSGRYSPGSYSRHKAGEYWVNTTKLESRPLYALPALSLHEGVPGHHTQIMLAAEMDLPDFRRSTYLSAFGEGWALYCEYLGKEAGIYETAYEEYGRLVYEMWRACRLVVDPGMHYLGWSRQKAFDFMKDNTALSILEIENEINRYIGWPGQAISYKLGELKIKELRRLAEEELGNAFDIRAFHDVVLSNGSVPLNTLERIVKNWIVEAKKTL